MKEQSMLCNCRPINSFSNTSLRLPRGQRNKTSAFFHINWVCFILGSVFSLKGAKLLPVGSLARRRTRPTRGAGTQGAIRTAERTHAVNVQGVLAGFTVKATLTPTTQRERDQIHHLSFVLSKYHWLRGNYGIKRGQLSGNILWT